MPDKANQGRFHTVPVFTSSATTLCDAVGLQGSGDKSDSCSANAEPFYYIVIAVTSVMLESAVVMQMVRQVPTPSVNIQKCFSQKHKKF